MNTSAHPLVVALTKALEDASSVLDKPADEITVEHIEAKEWPDSCLGAPSEGEACAEVLTPGYRIRMVGGLIYHADQRGNVRVARRSDPYMDTELRLRYTISGGIGGRTSSYETDSTQLTDAEEAELRDLIDKANFFEVENLGSAPVIHDGYVYRLWIAVGKRNHEVVRGDGFEIEDTEAMNELMSWAYNRAPSLFPNVDAIN
ncbi:MAG: protealysin inhibitor emfourin [Gulosibacter sp.]|uniref:protealysin inhibitor emfourin n=1 Tax=Gulosibacter sp. TaxID=2817531 RepID=UPI003F8F6A09